MSPGTGTFVAVGLLLALAVRHEAVKARRQRDEARFLLALNLARIEGERQLQRLLDGWERHVRDEGLEFADGDEAAYAFADYLANETGETIISQQLDGDGIVIAIPDPPEQPDA